MLKIPCFYAQNPSSRDSVTGLTVECELTPAILGLLADMTAMAHRHEVAVSAAPVSAIYSQHGVQLHAQSCQMHVNLHYAWFTANWKQIALVSEPVLLADIGVIAADGV